MNTPVGIHLDQVTVSRRNEWSAEGGASFASYSPVKLRSQQRGSSKEPLPNRGIAARGASISVWVHLL